MTEGGSARARAEELWARAAAERAKEEQARALAESLEAQAGAWDAGAEGERRVAAALSGLPRDWHTLHDRLLDPGRRQTNLDHVVVGPGGVFLVDAKNWAGGTSVHDGNLFQHHGGASAKGWQLDAVSRFAAEMERSLGVPVVPVVALAGGHGHRFRPQRVRGVDVVPHGRLVRWLRAQPTGLDAVAVDILVRKVAHTYPPASPDVAPGVVPQGATMLTVPSAPPQRRPYTRPQSRLRRPVHGRAGRGRRAVARAVLGILLLLVASQVLPRVVSDLLPRLLPGLLHSGVTSAGDPVAAPDAAPNAGPAKACLALAPTTIQKVTRAIQVTEKPSGSGDLCTWWLTKPRYSTARPDVSIETGRPALRRFAATGTRQARVDLLPGEVSAWLPSGTRLPGSSTAAPLPVVITLRFSYAEGATDRQKRAAESTAEKRVTRLAEELSRALVTQPVTSAGS